MTSDSIKELDLNGIIKFVNSHGLARVAAQNASEVLNTHWTSQWPQHMHARIEHALDDARDGKRSEFEADCITPTGKVHYWDVTTIPLLNEAGKVKSILAINRDITGRRQAEMALETLKEALNHELKIVDKGAAELGDHLGRTSHLEMVKLSKGLTHAKLLEHELDVALAAQRMAEAAAAQAQKGEAVGQLLAGVVHDLNNVLQAASAAIELVQGRNEIASREQLLLTVAQEALGHGATMSKRLLGFAQNHPYAPERADLGSVVARMLPLLQQAVGGYATLEFIPPSFQCAALFDPHTIERALMNLVINARDASAQDGLITVTVDRAFFEHADAVLHRRAGNYVTLSVVDHGEGIAPHVRDRLFEAYFTTKPSGKGTGLGLSQVYGAVRQANGFIEVVSKVGKGSTFIMGFPSI
ncbi:two-component system sensor histidine kinase NtrB [Xanthomonas citri]|uniref:two-component system sensor histidine kinase NtrB n=1 Tax=Xanthomonas citri TaxID=346 RepID=UPI001F329FC8|nr:PAS domain-containing sensor histidine kinase [Xanthomonas citri]